MVASDTSARLATKMRMDDSSLVGHEQITQRFGCFAGAESTLLQLWATGRVAAILQRPGRHSLSGVNALWAGNRDKLSILEG
jgi:hypothetical protein